MSTVLRYQCTLYLPLIRKHLSGRRNRLTQMFGGQHGMMLNLHFTQFARLSTSLLSSLPSCMNERAVACVSSIIPSLSSSWKKFSPWHDGIITSIIARKAAMINVFDCMIGLVKKRLGIARISQFPLFTYLDRIPSEAHPSEYIYRHVALCNVYKWWSITSGEWLFLEVLEVMNK